MGTSIGMSDIEIFGDEFTTLRIAGGVEGKPWSNNKRGDKTRHCLLGVRTQDREGCASLKRLSILSLSFEANWSVAGVAAPVGVISELGTRTLSIRNVLSMPHLALVAASSRMCKAS